MRIYTVKIIFKADELTSADKLCLAIDRAYMHRHVLTADAFVQERAEKLCACLASLGDERKQLFLCWRKIKRKSDQAYLVILDYKKTLLHIRQNPLKPYGIPQSRVLR